METSRRGFLASISGLSLIVGCGGRVADPEESTRPPAAPEDDPRTWYCPGTGLPIELEAELPSLLVQKLDAGRLREASLCDYADPFDRLGVAALVLVVAPVSEPLLEAGTKALWTVARSISWRGARIVTVLLDATRAELDLCVRRNDPPGEIALGARADFAGAAPFPVLVTVDARTTRVRAMRHGPLRAESIFADADAVLLGNDR